MNPDEAIAIAAIAVGCLLIGWAIGAPLGWSPFLWIATGLGISLGVFYIAYVILAERDDGRIQRELDEARRAREAEGQQG